MQYICSKRSRRQFDVIMKKTLVGEFLTFILLIIGIISMIVAILYVLYRYNTYAADINNRWIPAKSINELIIARIFFQFFGLLALLGVGSCCWCAINDARAKLIKEMDIYDSIEGQSGEKRKN